STSAEYTSRNATITDMMSISGMRLSCASSRSRTRWPRAPIPRFNILIALMAPPRAASWRIPNRDMCEQIHSHGLFRPDLTRISLRSQAVRDLAVKAWEDGDASDRIHHLNDIVVPDPRLRQH